MFEEFMGYFRMDKKWAKLFKEVKSDDEESTQFTVNVGKKFIIATDGAQIVRVERPRQIDMEEGYYMFADRICVPVDDEKANFHAADIDARLERQQFTKTAILDITEYLLAAITQAIREFGVCIDIGRFRGALEAIAALKPSYVRMYGFADAAVAKVNGVKLEMLVEPSGEEPIVLEYMVMPLTVAPDRFVKVDNQPMLWDLRKAS